MIQPADRPRFFAWADEHENMGPVKYNKGTIVLNFHNFQSMLERTDGCMYGINRCVLICYAHSLWGDLKLGEY